MDIKNIKDIKLNPNNPRIIKDDKFKKLVESVKNFPEMLEIRPIVVNKDMIILGGNMRYKACKEAWIKEIPVIVADFTEEQEREFLIKDNVSGGEWDWDILANEWDKEELEEWGLDVQFETVEPEAEEDDFEVDEGVQTDIVVWDLFEIWPHRLLCWDSTNIDHVEKLMNWEKADMVFTDPPYKIQTEWWHKSDLSKSLQKQWKSIEFIADFDPKDFLWILPMLFEKNKANAYIFCNKELLPDYLIWARDIGYSFNVLIWKKPSAIPIWDSHRPDIEYLLLFRKNAIWNNWQKDVNYSRCLEYWREKWLHPTMKPIELLVNEMKISSNKWSLVIDCFWWSGSTMVACHQINRKCYMSELDPKYVQTIINRMIKLDSTLEIKRNWIHYKPVISE